MRDALGLLASILRGFYSKGPRCQSVVFFRKTGTIYRPDAPTSGLIFNLRGGPTRRKPVKLFDAMWRPCGQPARLS